MRPKIGVLALALFFALVPATALAASGAATWEQMLPATTAQSLKGVTFVSGSQGWAVGAAGVVLRTENSGRTWRRVSVPSLNDTLNDAAFTSAARGWVVGDRGAIVRTVDGGDTWESVKRPVSEALLSVSAASSRTIVAVGRRGTIVRTTDGGQNWTKRTSPSPATLTDVRFFSANTVIAVTDKGSILRSTDAGRTWYYARKRSSTSYGTYADRSYRSSVDSISSSVGWVTGPQGVLKTTNGGRTWSRMSTKGRIEAVDFVNSTTGYAVINADADLWLAANAYSVYKTSDGGRTWKRVYTGSSERGNPPVGRLAGINCTSTRQCVVGASGTIAFAFNGTTWDEASAPMPALYDVSFRTPTEGWAVRQQVYTDGERVGEMPVYPRTLLKTTDAGATWVEMPSPSGHFGEWVVFSSATNGWFANYEDNPSENGTVYATVDGGSTWTTSTAIVHKPFFLDSQNGWAPGLGATIQRTRDGGSTWQTINLDLGPAPIGYALAPIRDVAFATESLGWCIAYGRIYVSNDGGDTWQLQHIEDSQWLHTLRILSPTSAWAAGWRSYAVYVATIDSGANWNQTGNFFNRIVAAFPAQNTLFRMDYVSGGFTLHKSTDGGATWVDERIAPFSQYGSDGRITPEHLLMADTETGWLYGGNGQLSRRFPTALLGTPESTATASVGETITVDGTFGSTTPEPGGHVELRLWRQSGADWLPSGSASATVDGSGQYLGAVSLPKTGVWRVRAYHHADVLHNSSRSPGFATVTVVKAP